VQILTMAHEYQDIALSVRMLGEVMSRTPEVDTVQRRLCPNLRGGIAFEGVTFAYEPERAPALDDVSFTMEAGTILGVVGRSGSGKTTVTRLIQRLYPVQQGLVRIDGHDIREIDLAHLRNNVGVVLQDSFLFRGTIRENLAAPRPSASFEQIVRAAHIAGAREFVERLPHSFDTMLEENAENLSGGQKQRLAIARALVTDPRLLILDEATSALDPATRGEVVANIRDLMRDGIVIFITHDMDIATLADEVLPIGAAAQPRDAVET
jgi:ATP-binding cassette subfamily B protein